MILNMATDVNSRTNTRRTPLHFSIPQHHSCQFAYSDIFDVGEHTSVAAGSGTLFIPGRHFFPDCFTSGLWHWINSRRRTRWTVRETNSTLHVCVLGWSYIMTLTSSLTAAFLSMDGHTHTHTQWVWLLRGVPCTDRHTSDKLRPGLTQVEENI